MLRGGRILMVAAVHARTAGQGVRAPLTAIRRFCLDCQGASARGVRSCADSRCPLWPWRLALRPGEESPAPMETAARQALRAIRRQCLCCAGARADVRACVAREDCALWHFRFGVRPGTYRAVRRRFFAPKPLRLL